jgi:uridine kinase
MQDARVVLGVAGGSGSGKTTVVREIVRGLGPDQVTLLHHDAYYRDLSHLPLEERIGFNLDHPDALETELLVQHLHALRAGFGVALPTYDFTRHIRLPETIPALPRRVILVDGILILWHRELRDLMDIKVFVDADADVRLMRRLQRDVQERDRTVDSVIRQYAATVRPMHLEFVEPSKRYADLIVPEGGFNRVAVDMLLTKIRAILGAPRQPIRE